MAFQNIKTEKSSCLKYSIAGLLALRHVISKTIKGLHKKNIQNTRTANQEWRTLNAIKKKINECYLKITQADRH
jgi:hypothetical protein